MLLFFTLLIAVCGLLYELILGTLGSYLIGDSVKQFSFTIGFFMSGMGIGAYISRFLEKNAVWNFLKVELILSVVGASSVIFLKMMYLYSSTFFLSFQFFYFFITILLGLLVGIEIPLVAAIYKELKIKTQSVISDIFTFDNMGALMASLLFPLLLLPFFGLYYVAIFVGSINLLVGILYLNFVRKKITVPKNILRSYILAICTIFVYFGVLLASAEKIENFYLKFYFKEPILQSYQTDYQNIVLTKRGEDLRMYINGNIQFNSLDEKRYHEALVDWPMKTISEGRELSVLVLGGGDGLVVRNLLKHDRVKNITLVELDPQMIEISSTQRDIVDLNEKSLQSEKLEIITADAFKFIEKNTKKYDFIIADFPDPRDVGTSKLYSKEFYIGIHGSLDVGGVFVTQASSAFFATKAFWSIDTTLQSVFGESLPYHRYLPSFGDWGFVMAQKEGKNMSQLGETICPTLGCNGFDEDYLTEKEGIEQNTLTRPVIIEYYGEGYKKYNL